MNPVDGRPRGSGARLLDKRSTVTSRAKGQPTAEGAAKNGSNPRNSGRGGRNIGHNSSYLRHTTQSVSQMAENMLTMNSDDESEAELAPKRTRRNKKNITDQDKKFVCGCKKTYLSYAALYTHTKVKHQGIFPEGTDTGIKKKQGRPKKLITSAMVKTAKILRKKKDLEPKVKELFISCKLLRKPEDHYNPADHFPSNDIISEKLTKPMKEAFLRLLKESKSLLSQFRLSVQHDISEIQSVEGFSIAESGTQSQWHSLIGAKSKSSAEQRMAWEIPAIVPTKEGDSSHHHQALHDDTGIDGESGEEEVDALDFIKEAAQLASDAQIPSKLHPITAAGKKPVGEALSKDAKDTKKAYTFSKLVMPVLVESLEKKETTATDCFCLFLFFLAEWLNPKAFTEAFTLLAAYRGLLNTQGSSTEQRIREEYEDDQREQHAMKEDAHEDGSSLDSEEMDDGRSRGARSETFNKPKIRHLNLPDELDILPVPMLIRQVSTHSTNRSTTPKTPRASTMFNLKKAQTPDFSDSHSADVVPDLANEFCTSYLPDLMCGKVPNQPALQVKNFSLIGKTKDQKHATIYFVKLLCNWLCSFGFSEGNVELDKASLGYTQSEVDQTLQQVLGAHPATEF